MVILVDTDDTPIGEMPKLEAHKKGLLHRAFSVVLFNSNGEMLLQRRAADKYHSGGLWTNSCCSHPSPGSDTEEAAYRRLEEEMGIKAHLKHIGTFIYKAELEHGLTEYEFDHVYTGSTDSIPVINPGEVSDYRYMSQEQLTQDMAENPENYTAWFKIITERFGNELFRKFLEKTL